MILGPGVLVQVETERDARSLIDARHPGAFYALVHRAERSLFDPVVDETGDETDVATEAPDCQIAVMIALVSAAPDRPPSVVSIVRGAVHGSACVPFSAEVWGGAIDLLAAQVKTGPSSPSHESSADITPRHDARGGSWSPKSTPHAFRVRPDGVSWPVGPREETCADCGCDPLNRIHRAR